MSFNCQSGLVLLTDYNDFRVTKISVSYITGENHIGSSFIRQKYFCLPTEIAVLPTEAWNLNLGFKTIALRFLKFALVLARFFFSIGLLCTIFFSEFFLCANFFLVFAQSPPLKYLMVRP
jgi:hypothetical protein